MGWLEVGEVANAVGPIATAGAAWLAAVVAYRGLSRWRIEAIGKRRAELAEEVLVDFYEARDAIENARFPVLLDNEEVARKKADWESQLDTEILNNYSGVIDRLNSDRQVFARLQARKYKVVALFGQDAVKPYEELAHIRTTLHLAVQVLITTYMPGVDDYIKELPSKAQLARNLFVELKGVTTKKQLEAFVFGLDGHDQLSKQLDEVVQMIEHICRPAVEEAAR